MAEMVDGNKIAREILDDLKEQVRKLKKTSAAPRLAVILVGQDPSSLSYIKMKKKSAEEVGLTVELKTFPDTISQIDLENAVGALNPQADLSGILIQLPLPPTLNRQKILDKVAPDLDVDCLSEVNKQSLISGKSVRFVPPAAAAILRILEACGIDFKGKNILLIGSGDLVGKPLAALLLQKGINFHLANRYTENLGRLAQEADVIISGAGQPGLVKGEMVKAGAVVIDAGTTGSETGAVVGDVETSSVSQKARILSSVPGGVGPVTVAMLLHNVVKSALAKATSP